MNDILSNYQQSLLNMIFCGDMDNRGKFNLIIAEHITPHEEKAAAYMQRDDKENELKQVLVLTLFLSLLCLSFSPSLFLTLSLSLSLSRCGL